MMKRGIFDNRCTCHALKSVETPLNVKAIFHKKAVTMTPARYVDRDEAILAIASGRRTLHVGCVGGNDFGLEDRLQFAPRSLHWKLTSITEVVGIDHSAEVITAYRKQGIFDNILLGDVQQLQDTKLTGTFDVVIAADIIEHLSNPGLMLEGIKPFCHKDSKIIITTPHAFGLPNYIRFLRKTFRDSPEHVMTFNLDNLCNLLNRHGYSVQTLDTCYQSFARQHRISFGIGKLLLTRLPRLGGTLFVVATLRSHGA